MRAGNSLKNILEDAANRLAYGEAELKWRHVKSPEYLLSEIADLDRRERLEFPLPDTVEVAQEDFITQDEIDYALGGEAAMSMELSASMSISWKDMTRRKR